MLAQAMKSLPMGTAYAVWTGSRPGGGDCGHRFLQRAYQRRADLFATLLLVGIVG
ncbi:MAG: SMR family transporter [Evtepia sp.]